jgi:hypothetical protein
MCAKGKNPLMRKCGMAVSATFETEAATLTLPSPSAEDARAMAGRTALEGRGDTPRAFRA